MAFAELTVGDVMSSPVVTLTQGQSLPLARELMTLSRVRHLPVVDADGNIAGIVTHRDLLEASVSSLSPVPPDARNDLQHVVPVARIMRREVQTIGSDELLFTAALRMRDHGVGCLPVVDGGKLRGIVSEADVVSAFLDLSIMDGVPDEDELPANIPTLRQVMTPAPQLIAASQPVTVVHEVMRTQQIRHLPVVIAEELYGIVSERDVAIAEAACPRPDTLAVGELVKKPAFVVNADARIEEVSLDLANQKLGSAIVMERGEVIGIITTIDLCRELGLVLRRERAEEQSRR